MSNSALNVKSHAGLEGSPKKPVDIIPLVTTGLAVLGFVWGIIQYVNQKERELMRPWLEDQRDTYVDALKAAEIMANGEEGESRSQAIKTFTSLYNGRMILVETKPVCQAMKDFRNSFESHAPKDELAGRCRQLASAMAQSMALSSTMSYSEFNNAKFIYGRDTQRDLRGISSQVQRLPSAVSPSASSSESK